MSTFFFWPETLADKGGWMLTLRMGNLRLGLNLEVVRCQWSDDLNESKRATIVKFRNKCRLLGGCFYPDKRRNLEHRLGCWTINIYQIFHALLVARCALGENIPVFYEYVDTKSDEFACRYLGYLAIWRRGLPWIHKTKTQEAEEISGIYELGSVVLT
ncbi:hypothetical protein BDN72DRAFT_877762 [Pluteus cervinus]|uniref:Uncharacterized protein n=1 Tax=Pluteus cervinus TaxID=181527 RepID=A0ACD3AWX0_9AGAR|nr:hypothetical protein BDN72DRAFT_877762 [Pluteus cervinus]